MTETATRIDKGGPRMQYDSDCLSPYWNWNASPEGFQWAELCWSWPMVNCWRESGHQKWKYPLPVVIGNGMENTDCKDAMASGFVSNGVARPLKMPNDGDENCLVLALGLLPGLMGSLKEGRGTTTYPLSLPSKKRRGGKQLWQWQYDIDRPNRFPTKANDFTLTDRRCLRRGQSPKVRDKNVAP